jgi:hypothetical protein
MPWRNRAHKASPNHRHTSTRRSRCNSGCLGRTRRCRERGTCGPLGILRYPPFRIAPHSAPRQFLPRRHWPAADSLNRRQASRVITADGQASDRPGPGKRASRAAECKTVTPGAFLNARLLRHKVRQQPQGNALTRGLAPSPSWPPRLRRPGCVPVPGRAISEPGSARSGTA